MTNRGITRVLGSDDGRSASLGWGHMAEVAEAESIRVAVVECDTPHDKPERVLTIRQTQVAAMVAALLG